MLKLKIRDINILSDENINIKMQNAVSNKENRFEFKHKLANEIICTRRIASALYDEKGIYNGAIVHTHNITDQKLLEAQLRHSQKMQCRMEEL